MRSKSSYHTYLWYNTIRHFLPTIITVHTWKWREISSLRHVITKTNKYTPGFYLYGMLRQHSKTKHTTKLTQNHPTFLDPRVACSRYIWDMCSPPSKLPLSPCSTSRNEDCRWKRRNGSTKRDATAPLPRPSHRPRYSWKAAPWALWACTNWSPKALPR